jgi:hypothetical protein
MDSTGLTTTLQTPLDIFELLSKIIAFLPRTDVDLNFDHASDGNLACSGVSMNWLTVARESSFWSVGIDKQQDAIRLLASLESNKEYADINPRWPRMNSTRSLWLGRVYGLGLVK